MNETDARIAVVTETWLRDGQLLEEKAYDLAEGAGVGILTKNRKEPAANGVTYGGVAVLWQETHCNFKEVVLRNVGDAEILACAGSLRGHSRTICVLACYLPPNIGRRSSDESLDKITDAVVELKRRFTDPYIIIAGDYNQWKAEDALLDFPDIREADVGPTRKDKQIDRIFTSMGRSITESGTLAPLETEEGQPSNHRVAYCRVGLERVESFVWQTYSYRYYNEASVKDFFFQSC